MGAATYIFANTGQLVRLVVQTLNNDGYQSDGYQSVNETLEVTSNGQTVFTLLKTPTFNAFLLEINGLKQEASDYIVIDNQLIWNADFELQTTDVVEVQYFTGTINTQPISESLPVLSNGQTIFELNQTPTLKTLILWVNGLKQANEDYKLSGNQIEWLGDIDLQITDIVEVLYFFGNTVDISGGRADGYVPVVQSIQYPDLSFEIGYPRTMTKLSTGLYAHGLLLPTGADALGTYVASVYWEENGSPKWETFAINVARPFGVSAISPV